MHEMLERFREVNLLAPFNRWAGIEVTEVSDGEVRLHLPWREDLGQYSGFLHASLIGGLIDTACGFAAATVSGRVLISQFSVTCISPAVGVSFDVVGKVIKAGRRQVFTQAELFAKTVDGPKLVAMGSAIAVPVGEK